MIYTYNLFQHKYPDFNIYQNTRFYTTDEVRAKL